MLTRALLLSALVMCVAASPAFALSKTETDTEGNVTANFSYTYKKTRFGTYDYSNTRISISREGQTIDEEELGKECSYCEPWPASGAQKGLSSVNVVDLDADGEPEVLVDLYSGGANCCWYSLSYRYDASQNKYIQKVLRPGLSFPYTLKDLDKDGVPEFQTIDYRFAYKYGSNADTPRPLRIFDWNAGRLIDVTIAFPALAARDAADMYKAYLQLRKEKQTNLRGLLAAYLADSYNAKNGKAAWRRVVASYRRGELNRKSGAEVGPFGRKYLTSLRSFLKKLGYLRTV